MPFLPSTWRSKTLPTSSTISWQVIPAMTRQRRNEVVDPAQLISPAHHAPSLRRCVSSSKQAPRRLSLPILHFIHFPGRSEGSCGSICSIPCPMKSRRCVCVHVHQQPAGEPLPPPPTRVRSERDKGIHNKPPQRSKDRCGGRPRSPLLVFLSFTS